MESSDFFISYTDDDRQWAEWVAWQLEDVGFRVKIQAWDFRPGQNFVIEMQKCAIHCDRTLAILSERFLASGFTAAEWSTAFATDPTGELGKLIFIRVGEVSPTGLLRPRVYIDLVNVDEEIARQRLVTGLQQARAKPLIRPQFPSASFTQQPQFPSGRPAVVHNLPYSSHPLFSGRNQELTQLRTTLINCDQSGSSRICAIHGFGGTGKTQLAIEYAWAAVKMNSYDSILWVKADDPQAFIMSLTSLAGLLRIPELQMKSQSEQLESVLEWLREHRTWLLIIDNADSNESVAAVRSHIQPSLPGDIIITSRISQWPPEIRTVKLDCWSPSDAATFLFNRCPNAGSETDALRLSSELGFLPLALEQAAAFILEVQYTFEGYIEAFRSNAELLLSEHRIEITRYSLSVAKTWLLTLDRLSESARGILQIAAWFGPDPIPRGILVMSSIEPDANEKAPISKLDLDRALGELARFSLIKLDETSVVIHRLLQFIQRNLIQGSTERNAIVGAAISLLTIFVPRDSSNLGNYSVWTALLPHVETLIDATNRFNIENEQSAFLKAQLSGFLATRGEAVRAEILARSALETCEKLFGPNHSRVGQAMNVLACILEQTSQFPEAESLHRKSLAIFEAESPKNAILITLALNNLAILLQSTDRYSEAEQFYRRALRYANSDSEMGVYEVTQIQRNLSWALEKLNRLDEAEFLLKNSLEIAEKAFGQNDLRSSRTLNDLGYFYLHHDNAVKAEPLLKRCLEIQERLIGDNHPELSATLDNLGAALRYQKNFKEAEHLHRRAIKIEENCETVDHPRFANFLVNLAMVLSDTGRFGEAERLLRRALAIDEGAFGNDHTEVAIDLNRLGNLLCGIGRFAQAEKLLQRALRILKERLPFDHPETLSTQRLLTIAQHNRK